MVQSELSSHWPRTRVRHLSRPIFGSTATSILILLNEMFTKYPVRNIGKIHFQEGYTIYIVTGPLQDCAADPVLRLCPATQSERPKLIAEQRQTQSGQQQSGSRRDPRTMQSPQQPAESPQVTF